MKKNNFLLTGSSGFLGKIIYSELAKVGNIVKDINDINGQRIDITLPFNLKDIFAADVIIHVAGKAHMMPKTTEECKQFDRVNYLGTKNLCHALQNLPSLPKSFVFISSVSVYGLENGNLIEEDHELLGVSPYAQSKIKAEKFIKKWGDKNGISTLILRIPLVAGPNPPGNLGKMIKGIKSNRYFSINKGMARRSVVMGKDIAFCILNNYWKTGIYNLTDNNNPSFKELEETISNQLGKKKPPSLPVWLGKIIGRIGDLFSLPISSDTISKMSNDLTFSCEKAKKDLDWKPRSVIEHFKIQ